MLEHGSERIVFTDPGLDDTASLLYLKHLGRFIVSSSYGNIPEVQAFKNIRLITDVLQVKDWVVVHGPEGPIGPTYKGYADKAVYKGNGENGLWNIETPPGIEATEPLVLNSLEEIDPENVAEILSLTPLTGPLILIRRGNKPKRMLVMGGAFDTPGNVRPLDRNGEYTEGSKVAEWNIFKDSLAAGEFFKYHSGKHVLVVPADAGVDAVFTSNLIIKGERKPMVEHRFMTELLKLWATEYKKINPEVVERGLRLYDLIAVILYHHPKLAQWNTFGVEVNTEVGPELGRTYRSDSYPKCSIAMKVINYPELFEVMCETVFGNRHPLDNI